MRLSLASFLALSAVVSASASSKAQTTDNAVTVAEAPHSEIDRREERPFALMGVIGVGTPVGAVGVVGEWSPVRFFTLAAGVGTSVDWQVAITPRFEIPVSRDASIGFGGGVSAGKYVEKALLCLDCEIHTTTEWSRAYWANGELSIDVRRQSGFAWRTFVGMGQLINGTPDHCTEQGHDAACTGGARNKQIVYFGASWGYAF